MRRPASGRPSLHRLLSMHAAATLKAVLGLLGCVSVSACSLTVDASRAQCASDLDCTTGVHALPGGVCIDSLCEVKPEWSCLSLEAAEPALDIQAPGATLDVVLPVIDLVTQAPVPGLSAALCRKIDLNCQAPLARIFSNTDGAFELQLEQDFEGYLEIEAPDVVPGLYFFSPPLVAGERLPTLAVLSPTMMGSLMDELDAQPATGRGNALLTTQNCAGALSAGVVYETADAGPETRRFYAADGLPSVHATHTDASGYGGFLNLPAGPVSVASLVDESALPLASVSLLVRAGFITYGRILPRAHRGTPLINL
jgi:hypothetical protein